MSSENMSPPSNTHAHKILQKGTYIIVNARYNNSVLAHSGSGSDLVSAADLDEESPSDDKRWKVDRFRNGHYTIKNVRYAHPASCTLRPQPNDPIVNGGVRGQTPQQWIVKEMRTTGHFIISPTDNKDLFWNMSSDELDASITLRDRVGDLGSHWIFEKSEIPAPDATPGESAPKSGPDPGFAEPAASPVSVAASPAAPAQELVVADPPPASESVAQPPPYSAVPTVAVEVEAVEAVEPIWEAVEVLETSCEAVEAVEPRWEAVEVVEPPCEAVEVLAEVVSVEMYHVRRPGETSSSEDDDSDVSDDDKPNSKWSCDSCESDIPDTDPRVRCRGCNPSYNDLCADCALAQRFSKHHRSRHEIVIYSKSNTRVVSQATISYGSQSTEKSFDGPSRLFSCSSCKSQIDADETMLVCRDCRYKTHQYRLCAPCALGGGLRGFPWGHSSEHSTRFFIEAGGPGHRSVTQATQIHYQRRRRG
ncbi:hypothetical protein FB45DRAFT_945861 [Roridomyces roridus]|uniref:ZZ-type domain-containing protein n=1 Tax=Roridomyces roridus TaxID=1738132 RepID=A0AAD7F8I2_9AGAR|nr:hypothetical protein FB45DRAFT_945861 [Roridomyces roridus]